MTAVIIFGSALSAGGALVVYLIAADRTRYLARYDLQYWNERAYLSLLPNFLQRLHDNGFKSPWPKRLNAVSASWFKRRARRILKERPALAKMNFIHHHLNLQALLFLLKPFIDDAVLAEQAKIASDRLISMPDTVDRDRLIRFVDQVRAHRAQFHSSLTEFDRQTMDEMRRRNFLGTLRSVSAMFHEHGFDDIFVGLDTLRRWQSLEGKELVQELPALPKSPVSASRHNAGVVPYSGQGPES